MKQIVVEMKNRKQIIVSCLILFWAHCPPVFAQSSVFSIGRVKYSGGGDWYNDPSAEVNLLNYVSEKTGIAVQASYQAIEFSSDRIFSFPMLFLTGHGNIILNDLEVRRLREYLDRGGFLFADDDYGMDQAFRREIKKVFPEHDLVPLKREHPLFSIKYVFKDGMPKIHEHDDKPPQALGIMRGGRLSVLYCYESNPSDGWVDASVHNTPEENRQESFKFGTNLILYVLTQ